MVEASNVVRRNHTGSHQLSAADGRTNMSPSALKNKGSQGLPSMNNMGGGSISMKEVFVDKRFTDAARMEQNR